MSVTDFLLDIMILVIEKKHQEKWFERKGSQFIQILTQSDQEFCPTETGLSESLNKKFWQQHDKTILSPQYRKLSRQTEETVEEWKDKENNRTFKECLIN